MHKLKLLFTLVLLFTAILKTEPRFIASVSSNEVSAGERLQINFTLENASGTDFKAPSFKGFSVLSGPSRMQSTQIINGKVTSSISFTYVLLADNPGKYTIDPASIVVDNNRINSNSITITVNKGATTQPKQNDEEINLNQKAKDIVDKNLFIRLSVDKTQAYQGQPIVATYKLYVHPQLQVLNLGQPKMPTFNGFWTQDLGIKELKFTNENFEGTVYRVTELKKVVLLPQQSGLLEIEPMEIESVVRLEVQGSSRRRSPFGDPFFDDFFNRSYRDFKFNIKSRNSKINVTALPSNPPANFNGAVGNLKFETTMDKTKAVTGDAITLKVRISGSGNIKLIEPMALNLPTDIDVFEPKISENLNIGNNGMTGSKTIEYYLIPRNPGKFKIGPFSFAYFDLSTKSYSVQQSEEFLLEVEQGKGDASNLVSGVDKKNVEYVGKDILYIKTKPIVFTKEQSSFLGSPTYIILSLLPVLLFPLFLFLARRRDEMKDNASLMKLRRANALARKRLATARRLITSNNQDEFYDEISKALWGYSSDKLSTPVSELTIDKIKSELTNRNVKEDLINRMTEAINYCESARFAPSAELLSSQQVYEDAAKIIAQLEGELK